MNLKVCSMFMFIEHKLQSSQYQFDVQFLSKKEKRSLVGSQVDWPFNSPSPAAGADIPYSLPCLTCQDQGIRFLTQRSGVVKKYLSFLAEIKFLFHWS